MCLHLPLNGPVLLYHLGIRAGGTCLLSVPWGSLQQAPDFRFRTEIGTELCQQLHACVCVCAPTCPCVLLCQWGAGSEVVSCIRARCAILCTQHLCLRLLFLQAPHLHSLWCPRALDFKTLQKPGVTQVRV